MSDQIQVVVIGQETLVSDIGSPIFITAMEEGVQTSVILETITTVEAVEQRVSVNMAGVATVLMSQGLRWIDMVMRYVSTPASIYEGVGFSVYEYEHSDTTRYRRIPDPYDASQDSFFATFSGNTLSGLICSRV
jgi:hypothetical protein